MANGTVRRVLVPLTRTSEEERLVFSASILARWFDAPIQFVTDDESLLGRLHALAEGIGTKYEPTLVFTPASFIADVAVHAAQVGPSVTVVTLDGAGLELAACSSQPTFITAAKTAHRLDSGPLVVEVSANTRRLDSLAVAATWAQALGLGIRVVSAVGDPDRQDVLGAVRRIREMSIDVGVDSIRPHGLEPSVLVARSRNATAIVVSADRVAESELVERAIREGSSVLVAPVDTDSAPLLPDRSDGHRSTGPSAIAVLDPEACLDRLSSENVGRVGYIDELWPMVVPVNYSVRDGEIFFRSLSGGKLAAARRRAMVCLEADGLDPETKSGWSVLAHGELEVIDDPAVLKTAWRNDPSPWVDAELWQWLRLVPISLTGRLVASPTADDDEPAMVAGQPNC